MNGANITAIRRVVFFLDDLRTRSSGAYPLSLSQQNIWDVECTCPGTSVNNICTTLRIHGRIDFSALQRGVNAVLAADGSLRARIALQDKTPVQYQAPFQAEQIPIYDFSQTSQEGIENWEETFTREVMPLLDAPLYRFVLLRTGENSGGLVIKMHHLISDGWTQVLLCNRIGQIYLDLLDGNEPSLDPIPSYQDHVEEEQRYLSSAACGRDEAYWKKVLEQSGEPSVLKSLRGAAVSPVGRRLTFPLPQDLNNDIYTFCMGHRVAPFSVFYMALAIYFKRIGGADRFTIGVPIFNRMNFRAKQTSGMYVSTLPFFSQVSGDWSLSQFNGHLNEGWFNMLRHQRYPFDHIQKLAQETSGAAERLFHIAFSYQNSQLLTGRDATVTFSGRWHYSGYQLEQLCIHLSNLEDNRQYSVDYDYLTQFFSAQEIETLHACLVNILREALASPDRPIRQLSILSPEERERVVYTFNRSARPIFEPSLYARFDLQLQQTPNRAALICDGVRTTYRHLEAEAARVHAALGELPPGTLAAVLLPRTPRLFAAMLGILRAGGAFLLLTPNQPENRIREILIQSGAAALVTSHALGGALSDLLPIVDVENLPAPTDQAPVEPQPDALAYVVYTSGSTGAPKGVEISRRALLNLTCAMEPVYAKGAVLSVCSVGFDAFLLESAAALLNGRTILLPQDQELESPKALARLITGFGVGFLSTTPSRLSAFLKDPAFRRAMMGMESIICGGEAFPSDLLQRLQLVTKARIYNQYGPSEAAVAVSLKLLNGSSTITAGGPMDNCKLYILDDWGNPLPIGVYGNLYVGGVCVGLGYRNAPELTAQSFSENPFELGDRLYRTGDMACWTPGGEIILAGRSDRQVKLRGLRVEPQEVSACLCRHPQVKEAAAAVQRHSGQDVLVAYYTADNLIPEEELLSLCASFLPHYMIPSVILRLEALPLTPNGKVNEVLLPRPDLASSSQARPETQTQAELLTILRRALGRPDFGVDSDYFLFGGNSLNAMDALGQIAEAMGRTLRVSDLYTCRTARRLAALVDQETGQTAVPHLAPAPHQDRWPLTPIQQGIYVQSHLDPTGRTYHMAGAFRLALPPDIPRLEKAFQALIAQEPLLRTAFAPEPDGIFARVRPQADFALPIYQGASLTEAAEPLLAPFDLSHAPLLRAGLYEEAPSRWVLLLNIHHIIGDGLTTPVLLARLDKLYRGVPDAPRTLSYLDHAWHLAQHAGEAGRLDYWKEQFAALPESLELPGDFPRSRSFDFRGNTRIHLLSPALSAACDAYCAQHSLSPYMLFLGAFGLLMARLSGKEDLVVGTATAGRLLPETRDMCGPFINTLPLRLLPRKDRTVADYLEAVRSQVNGMLDHQQVGLEEIVSALDLPRALSQSPLFQVMFSQRPVDAAGFSLDGAPLEYIPLPTGTARMDLWIELYKDGDRYGLQMEYASQLFLDGTAAYYGRCLETLVAYMIAPGDRTLAELEALSPRDRMELLDIPHNTVSPFLNLPIHQIVAHQAVLDPQADALIFHGQTMTREALDARADQIAALLAAAGVTPGSSVGIAMKRGPDLVASMLAILKTGCAYVPLLASFPEQRLRHMAQTARISHVLCDRHTRSILPEGMDWVPVSTEGEASGPFVPAAVTDRDLANILFTSGSTGQPKGVMLRHRSVSNMFLSIQELLARADGPILCTTNLVFDSFIGETLLPLAMGKQVVLADEEEMMLPWKLSELIQRFGVEIVQFTPARFQMCLSNEAFCQAAARLKLILFGGEVLSPQLLEKTHSVTDAATVNMYGPTEATVYMTMVDVVPGQPISIGRPLKNGRIYVLDEDRRPVLPTAYGELYLAGEVLSAGYISRPDLTDRAFVPDPFFPGELMYRTGDIARLCLDGCYDFLGRRDAQVKLNGQRVELDEITGAIEASGHVLLAATVPVRKEEGAMELCSFYVPDPNKPGSAGEIRRSMCAVLPKYMMPSRLVALNEMPYTPSSKIDLRALGRLAASYTDSTGQENEAPSAPVAPPTPQHAPIPLFVPTDTGVDAILKIWQKVLGRTELSAERSFFEQGGTSLAALSVLSHYHNRKLVLSLAQFYEHPTALDQAALLWPGETDPSAALREPDCSPQPAAQPSADLSSYPAAVPVLPAGGDRTGLGTVLLTGATGFLGAHMLRALLDAGADSILCTMRDGSKQRLLDTLSWYFGAGWTDGAAPQLEVLRADITQPRLGLSPGDYQQLTGRVSAVYHCAADVRHYAADAQAFLNTNLTGTKTVIRLAQDAHAPLHHMSTASVGGERLMNGGSAVFTERDFDIGQDWQSNLYVKSKFLAEHAVFEAVRAGFTARVYRLGRLVGRSSDGIFQRNPGSNAFWLLARGIHALGAIPQSLAAAPVDLTPIDWCARAIAALRDSELTTYHIMSPTPPTLEEAARTVSPQLAVLSDEAFQRLLAGAPVDQTGDLLSPLLDFWNQRRAGPPGVAPSNRLTMEQLGYAGFEEPIPGPGRLLRAFRFDRTEILPREERI